MAGAIQQLDDSKVSNDAGWVKQAFFIPGNRFAQSPEDKNKEAGLWKELESRERRGKRFSSAEIKYTDTTPGGNWGINPRPQFTRWCDPKMPGIAKDSKGMGEYYSEAIDDNVQRIHLQFGVPEYNSLTNYFSRFYDYQLAHMINTGDASEFSFNAGKTTGFLLTIPVQILIGANNLINRLVAFASGNPYSRFYYMKPTMQLYWSTVSVLINKLGVNMGVLYSETGEKVSGKDPSAVKGNMADFNGGDITALARMLPDVMGTGGGIDIYRMASRAQRLAVQQKKALSTIGSGLDPKAYQEAVANYLTAKMDPTEPMHGDLPNYLNGFYKSLKLASKKMNEDKKPPVLENTDPKAEAANYFGKRIEMPMAEWGNDDADKLMKQMLEDGSAFASFNVDYEGSTSESFSNQTKTSDLANKLRGMSSSARDLKFTFGNGNIGSDFISNTVESIFGAVKGFAEGLASSVGFSGLFGLAGAVYPEIPDVWADSSAELPRNNYTIKLATPYGNKLSILLDIYIPLCMLLAGALPRTGGRAAYGPPFLCRLWSQGRNTIQLGIIDSLSIERGTGGIGWSVDKLPTAVDVNLSVISLDKVMHVPVTEIGGPENLYTLSMFDEDTAATNYLAALGGLGLYDQYYIKPKLSLALAKAQADWDTWTSPSHWAQKFVGSPSGRALSMFYAATDRN